MGIIITGAASGIGLATAHLLHSKGERVMLWDINETQLHSTGDLLTTDYSVVDVTDYEQICSALREAEVKLGQITGVIHCAGIAHIGPFAEQSISRHSELINVNLTGTVNVAHAAIPYLIKTRGSLIMVGSSSSFYGPPDFATYGATKAAIVRLAEALRLELEADGVHVGVISPHFVNTPMLEESRKSAMFAGASYTSSADDIAMAIDRMMRLRRPTGIPGAMNKLNYFLARHLPQLGPLIVRRIWQRGKAKRAST